MEPVAFLSYAHLDDAGSGRELSSFHDRLQTELRIHTGIDVHIFFDKKSIAWGKRWAEFINDSLESAAFLIPILTPAFFQSLACKDEYTKFVTSERKIGRRDLILPIYYVNCREMRSKGGADPIVDNILSRQYRDWRGLRHRPADSTDVLLEFANLASTIAKSFFEIKDVASLTEKSKTEKIDRDFGIVEQREILLDKEISYQNLVAYTVDMYPELPISREWTEQLIKDISNERYKSLRDIDREVKYAKESVDKYAQVRPDLFRHGTDFLTKSLIFSDSEFREIHPISPQTKTAAKEARITRY